MKKIILPITLIFLFSLIFLAPSVHAQKVGETLTGHYTYSDAEGDLEGVSLFQWYRDDVAIPGATNITYIVTNDDAGKTIVFEVTPVAITGTSPGTPIRSVGIAIDALPNSGGTTASTTPETSNTGDSSVNVNLGSSVVILPKAIGSGKTTVTIPMDDTKNIGTINSDGINILSYIGSKAIFNTSQISDMHSLTISNLDLASNLITLTIASTPKTISLRKDETKLVDLNDDGVNDLQITFANVYVNRAEITVKAITSVSIVDPTIPVVTVTPISSTVPKNTKAFVFKKDLKFGTVNNEVKELQKYLNASGYLIAKQGSGSKGKETTTFGPATKAALIKFQKAKKINPNSGFFGPLTRKVVNG